MEISDAHHQAMANHQVMEEMLGCPKSQQQQEKRLRPHPEQALKCPRCESTNTKFCYYNNYSLSQPRYFCKGCRRYWTKGGSLRNVPVGGGCRKNKRSNSSTSSSSKKAQDQDVTTNSNPLLPALPLPPLSYDPSDLTLAFSSLQNQPPMDDHDTFLLGTPNPNPNPNSIPTAPTTTGFLDILRSGFADTTNTPTGFQSCHYYGFGGNGSVEEVGGGVGGEGVMMFPFDGGLLGNEAVTVTTSQGSCKAMDGAENSKVVMGLQWPLGGDANLAMDSGRDYWNGVGSSNWHGLINSSLM